MLTLYLPLAESGRPDPLDIAQIFTSLVISIGPAQGVCFDSRITPAHGVEKRYSAFFLRRRTITPINRIASTAQTVLTVEVSMVLSFPRQC
jgi:hypothetical protein